MLAWEHESYEAYCAYNAKRGYLVLRRNVWTALKSESETEGN